METNLVIEGFKFMGLGMATVFSFLVILIIMMNAMSKIINKFFPEPKPSAGTITAAIKHHREG